MEHKKSIPFLAVIISIAAILITVNSAKPADWNSIEFPKFMYGDPTKAFRTPGVGHEPDDEHFIDISNLGINLFFTGIKYHDSDSRYYAVLDNANYNTVNIPVVLGDWVANVNVREVGGENVNYDLRYYNVSYALEMPAENFHEYNRLSDGPCGYYSNGALVGNPNDGAGIMADNDFDYPETDFIAKASKLHHHHISDESKCYVFIEAYTYPEYQDEDVILSLTIRGYTGSPPPDDYWEEIIYFRGTNYNNPGEDERIITDEPTWYCLVDDNDLKMYEDEPVQVKIESHGDENCNIYINKIGIYDAIGYQVAYDMLHEANYPAFGDFENDIEYSIGRVYSLDTQDLILDRYIDEPKECRLLNCIAIDRVLIEYTSNPLRFHTERHWGKNSTAIEGRHNYGPEYIGLMDEYGGSEPDWFMGQDHAYGCNENGTIKERQYNLSEYIGYKAYASNNYNIELNNDQKGLLYYTYINKEYPDIKPLFEIQCQEDYRGYENEEYIYHHRNPRNNAEIKVLGYLALGYGIRALGYYYYFSKDNVGQTPGYYGIYDWDDVNLTWKSAYCGNTHNGTQMPTSGDYKIGAVKDLNWDIDIMAYILNHLKVANTGTPNFEVRADCFVDGNPPTRLCGASFSHITDIVSQQNTEYIEVIELERTTQGTEIPDGDYFFVVNRDSSGMGEIEIHTNYDNSAPGTVYILEIMNCDWNASNPNVILDAGNVAGYFDAEMQIEPGCGILFRISDEYSWSGRATIAGNYVIPPGMTLEIAAGCTVQVFNDTTSAGAKSGGIIIANSSAGIRIEGASGNPVVFQRGYHCKADEDTAHDWVGIRFEGTAANPVNLDSSWIRYCNFDNVEVAVRIDSAKSGTALEMTGCQITDCDTAVYCNNGALDIDGLTISDTLNCAVYAKYSDLNVNKLTVTKNTGVDTGYAIYLYATDLDMDSSQLAIDNYGIYADGPEGDECTVNIVRSSFAGIDDHYGIRTLSGDLILKGRYPGLAYTVKDFDKGLYCTSTVCSLEASGDYWCKIVDNATIGAELSSCTGSKITSTLFSANGDTNVLGGGINMNSTSPLFQICYFEENKGPAVIATNGACPVFGLSQDETKGNEFDDNAASSSYNEKAIVREFNRAYSVFDDGANNFYLDALDYYIYNSYDSSELERAVTENFWDGEDPEENIDKFFPDEPDNWDFTDWSDTKYSIGDAPDGGGEGGGKGGIKGDGTEGGGGDNIESNSLLAAIRLENAGRYSEAEAAYQAIIDSTGNVREKQVAMRRLLDVSVAGGLNLSYLLDYYQNIKICSRNVQVAHAAANLKCKLFMLLRRYPEAIVEYETVFSGNPSLEDSVFALINIGEAYMLMQERGSASRTGITPTLPQLRPRSWADFEDRKQDLMTLLIARGRGISGGGDGDILSLLPQVFALHQNLPNPFNPVTRIRYDLPELSQVRLEVFNILGRKVCTLVNGLESAGYKNAVWKGVDMNGRAVSSGIYIYRLTVEGQRTGEKFIKSAKMLLLE